MIRKRKTWLYLVFFAVLLLSNAFLAYLPSGFFSRHALLPARGAASSLYPCVGHPSLLIVVLTYTRDASLARLLQSLSLAVYGCAQVDLHIIIDVGSDHHNPVTLHAQERCVEVATKHIWEHGCKTVTRRIRHAGLSQGWFESTYSGNQEYVAIFEDDMEVSEHFYSIFRALEGKGTFSGEDVTGFCLHPNDWDVRVDRPCENILYLSPEPCNWGPIWKRSSWQKYLDWVFNMKASGSLPYVPENISFEYNLFLREGKDVQSSWVWRFNFEFRQLQVRYSFIPCITGGREVYLSINHKEPGEHFLSKMNIQNTPDLLVFDVHKVLKLLSEARNGFTPAGFSGYESLTPLGANALGNLLSR